MKAQIIILLAIAMNTSSVQAKDKQETNPPRPITREVVAENSYINKSFLIVGVSNIEIVVKKQDKQLGFSNTKFIG